MLSFIGDHFLYLVAAAYTAFAVGVVFVTISDSLSRR